MKVFSLILLESNKSIDSIYSSTLDEAKKFFMNKYEKNADSFNKKYKVVLFA